ncbi:MAG: 2-isopropylmalate synthase [Rudaea sp.]|uniref:2-isopropylmalate synthase n=1 Tax=Rudaea sp. TaxID=2136325 RepID=UPI0039E4084F
MNKSNDPVATPARERVRIFDTTLRDGEQSPGFSMSRPQKLRMAHALAELGVDVLEAGFPQASEGDFEAVQAIARELRGPVIAGLARAQFGDIEACARALEPAQKKRIHIFLATSPLHRRHKLNMSREQVIETGIKAVSHAKKFCDDIEFSAEDAIRTEPDYLIAVLSAMIEAGATTVNVPDTVGYATPEEIFALFSRLKKEVRGIDKVILSSHCHNDLGLAVANSVAAVAAGARQVECTINGIGERAGNAALEEIVMALRTRADRFSVETGIRTRLLYPTARLLANVTGATIARNKAIVGDNAFAHESGIHQHGMLKNRETYEIMRPEDVGVEKTQLVLGKHSGKHALRDRLKSLGYDVGDAEVEKIFPRFKALADKKKEVFDSDLDALVLGQDPATLGPWHLHDLVATSRQDVGASASVKLRHDDGRIVGGGEGAIGDGPVHAAIRAIELGSGIRLDIADFQIRSLSPSADAQARATLTVRHGDRDLTGRGVSTDIVEAGALAALEVVNRIERIKAGQALPLVAKSA